MSRERVILCGELAADARWGDGDGVLRLPNDGGDRVVHFTAEHLNAALLAKLPAQLADLIELASFVYVADQCVSRGGAGVEDMGENWRRVLRFHVPVRCPDLWRRDDVAAALRDVLSFLSEDEYEFAFERCRHPADLQGYFDVGPGGGAMVAPERVVLFSGGLDSLGGAVDEVVVNGRPVVLLRHESTSKLQARHDALRALLAAKATRGPAPEHVVVRVNKKAVMNREYTQRSRSFLYASLAAAVARMWGLREAWFYENGTVSLNLPIARQVVGAKATRTTHPRTLAGFERLFSLVTGEPFGVRNGFLWRTKGEVVRGIVDAGCGAMIEPSTSCTHTWVYSAAKPHCGTCSQCIDRRFAVLAAGAEMLEPADNYRVDLLVGPRDAGEPRTMLASYVETAQQVATMSEAAFFARFGEAFRILRHLDGPPDANARRVYELYRRHGREVMAVIERGLAQHVAQVCARTLPETCLLRLVHDPSVPEPGAAPTAPTASATCQQPKEGAYLLRPCGQVWQLRFAGREPVMLLPAIGYRYLRELLRMPGKRFSVSELLVAVHGSDAAVPLGDAGPALDKQALHAYRQLLTEIDEELAEAEGNNDAGRKGVLTQARAELLTQLKGMGLKKRPKREKSDLNRIRNSVCNAVDRAMKAIGKYEPAAFEHLDASVSTGFHVTYNPQAAPAWEL